MDYIKSLEADLEKGYSKSDLEKLIGLPKNNLSGILKGSRKLSKKSQLKIDKWEASEKPHPLSVNWNRENKKPLTTISVIKEVAKRIGKKAIAITTPTENNFSSEPKENTMAFYLKYDCYTWAELKNKEL